MIKGQTFIEFLMTLHLSDIDMQDKKSCKKSMKHFCFKSIVALFLGSQKNYVRKISERFAPQVHWQGCRKGNRHL